MKRLIATVLGLCVSIGCMAGTAFASEDDIVVVGEGYFEYDKQSVETAYNGKVSYNGKTHTLTLKDWSYEGKDGFTWEDEDGKHQLAIYCTSNLKIAVDGDESVISLANVDNVDRSIGIQVDGNLSLSGYGSLKCTAGTATTLSTGAFIGGNLVADGSGCYLYGGSTTTSGDDTLSAGAVASGNITCLGSTLSGVVDEGLTVAGESYGLATQGKLTVNAWCETYGKASSGSSGVGIYALKGVLAKGDSVYIEAKGTSQAVNCIFDQQGALGVASCGTDDGEGFNPVGNTYDYTSEKLVAYNTNAVKMLNARWTGKPVKPRIDSGFLNRKDYTSISYSNNVKVGKGTAKVTGRGSYRGTVTATFKILPAVATIKAKAKKGSISISKWKSTGASAYKIQYRKKGSSSWKTAKTLKHPAAVKISKLKSNKTYQVRVLSTSSVGSTAGKTVTLKVK